MSENLEKMLCHNNVGIILIIVLIAINPEKSCYLLDTVSFMILNLLIILLSDSFQLELWSWNRAVYIYLPKFDKCHVLLFNKYKEKGHRSS